MVVTKNGFGAGVTTAIVPGILPVGATNVVVNGAVILPVPLY